MRKKKAKLFELFDEQLEYVVSKSEIVELSDHQHLFLQGEYYSSMYMVQVTFALSCCSQITRSCLEV